MQLAPARLDNLGDGKNKKLEKLGASLIMFNELQEIKSSAG
jgi:hypothetical protein